MLETWARSWDDLRREFEDSKETIKHLRLETEEEGKERAKREARKRATGRDAEDFDVVRFASATEEADVRFYPEAAIDLIPDLDAMFEREVPTLQFLAFWGAFPLGYGVLMASYSQGGRAELAAHFDERWSCAARRDRTQSEIRRRPDVPLDGASLRASVAFCPRPVKK